MKKALIFDPYLDTLGGGERYTLTVAKILKAKNYQVSLAWPNQTILESAAFRFGLDLSGVSADFKAFNLFKSRRQIIKKIKVTKPYDLVFFLSDGSIPFLFGKKNILHFQVPFKQIINPQGLNLVKFKLIDYFLYNSKFTQNVLETSLPKNKGKVIYPPIDTDNFKPSSKKQHVILAVGRFDSPSHSKRQDILIEAFKNLVKKTSQKYTLILAGGLIGQKDELQKLKNKASGFPIKFIINPDFEELVKLYGQAKYFWHAAGFGVDEDQFPDKVEHFGMTTVEAMASGCVPIVINKGGQKEIITPNTGFLWNTQTDLINFTLKLIKSPSLTKKMSIKARQRSKDYNIKAFTKKLTEIL